MGLALFPGPWHTLLGKTPVLGQLSVLRPPHPLIVFLPLSFPLASDLAKAASTSVMQVSQGSILLLAASDVIIFFFFNSSIVSFSFLFFFSYLRRL